MMKNYVDQNVASNKDRRGVSLEVIANSFYRANRDDFQLKGRLGFMWLLLASLFVLSCNNVFGATIATAGSGNWSSTSTWQGGVLPVPGDNVTISNGHTLTVDGNYTISNVSFEATNSGGLGTLTVSSGFALTITGGLFAPDAGTSVKNDGNYTISGAGAISCGSLSVGNSTTPTGSSNTTIILISTISSISVAGNLNLFATIGNGASGKTNNPVFDLRSGTVTVNGSVMSTNSNSANSSSILMTNGVQTGSLILSGATPFSLSGTGTNTTSFNGTSAKVTYNNAGAQAVRSSTYTNLTLAGGGLKTTSSVTVNGILSMEGTATASVAPTYGTAATLQYNTATDRNAGPEWITPFVATGGVVIANTGQISLNGDKVLNTSIPLTINSNAKLNTSSSSFALTFNGDFVNNGTLIGNASNITIAGAAATQNIGGFTTTGTVSMTKTGGTATATGNFEGGALTINGAGGTLNLGSGRTHIFSGNWNRTAGTLNAASSTLYVGGSAVGSGSTFVAGTSIVIYYSGTGGKDIAGVTYNEVRINNGSGTNTALGDITANTLTSASGGTLNMSTFQLSGISSASGVAGTIRTQNTSTTPIPTGLTWGGLIQYDASSGGQTIVPGTYSNIHSGGTSGTNTLGGDISVGNTLTIAASTTLAFGTSAARTVTLYGPSVNAIANNGTLNMSSGGAGLAHLLRIASGTVANFGALINGTNSTVEYNGASQTVSAVDYNHLLLSGTGTKTLQALPMTISGNFSATGTSAVVANANITVNGNVSLNGSTSFNAGSYNLTVKGNFSNNGTFIASAGSVTMNGSSPQTIGGLSTTAFNNFTINNTTASLPSATVTLNRSIDVNGALTLTRGYLVTTSSNILTMGASSSSSGSSASSYVNGPMTKTGSTAFEFPIGDAVRWARIGIGVPSSSSTFRAQYFSSAYANTSSLATSPTPVLASVSSKEYWQLDRTSGTGDAQVSLFWEDASWSGITDCSTSKLRVAHWNGSGWQNNNDAVSVSGSCVGTSAGSVTTTSAVTSFSPFSFGVSAAPLPVELVSFTAECTKDGVQFEWSTASELNNDFFLLQRSPDAKSWEPIAQMDGAGTSQERNFYETTDKNPLVGTSYYRLQQVDFDGNFEYSKTVSIFNCAKENHSVLIYPNPSSGKYSLLVEGQDEIQSITIFDGMGKQVFFAQGFQPELDLSGLPNGQYLVKILVQEQIKVERLIKN